MAYLILNGVTVRVAVDSVSLRYMDVGGVEERSPSGSLEGGPLVKKREWAMATTPVSASELDAWVGLIEGMGHVFPYNADLYSTRGRGAASSTGAALVTSGMKYGAAHLLTAMGGSVSYSTVVASAWTVLLWRKEADTWRHYLIRSDGGAWQDGVRDDAMEWSLFLVVSGGTVAVGDFEAADLRSFDDVVVLPYAVPDSWVAPLYAQHNAVAWSTLPRLSSSGTFASSAVTVRGKVTDIRAIRYSPAGTLTTGHTIQFTLSEV